ncbi:plant cysteine oxidase 2 [Amaranthus tricolor]|uniref:plant cysteine oxidase 2 n=1 Tax=Amaranthus tricolor TaxID=29722 RepID=UPI0025843669|nr:plant cysteine oxidase 2 [Amaranthus tricolor]
MGIKPGVASQKGKELSEVPQETTTNSSASSRRNRRRNRKASPVQTLYHTCKEVFATGGNGFIPPPNDVERLRSILDILKAEDVGLSPSLPYFRIMRSGRPVITYLHLYECEKFSIGIFCLPPSGVLPLHNHPGMTVFSKILFGTMHIKSFDWAEDLPCSTVTLENAPEAEARLAKLKVNADFVAPCNTSILYPAAGGNMHCFTAVTACAVLDVLGPPYSDPDGRHCTYYREYPFDHFSVDGISMLENEKDSFAWLQEREKPRELTVIGAPYVGPKIVDS